MASTAVRKYNLEIYEDTEVVHHEFLSDFVTIITAKQHRIMASHAIFAMGYETQEFKRDRMFPHKIEQLRQHIAASFPSITTVKADYSWAATFGSTHDGYPMIGPHPNYPRCLFIEGYGGNGTVYCAISTEIIPALINQGSHPDASLFSLTRSSHPSPD